MNEKAKLDVITSWFLICYIEFKRIIEDHPVEATKEVRYFNTIETRLNVWVKYNTNWIIEDHPAEVTKEIHNSNVKLTYLR